MESSSPQHVSIEQFLTEQHSPLQGITLMLSKNKGKYFLDYVLRTNIPWNTIQPGRSSLFNELKKFNKKYKTAYSLDEFSFDLLEGLDIPFNIIREDQQTFAFITYEGTTVVDKEFHQVKDLLSYAYKNELLKE